MKKIGAVSDLNGLSLFSGVGGLDIAFEQAGGKILAFCELEPFCKKVLSKHWPDVPIFGDVRALTKEVMRSEGILQTVDVIYGGFPCQPFSVAGDKKGKDDVRYLWPEFSRLVGELRPSWVVAENVPGILRIAADEVCADLEREGYSVGIWDYEAASIGAPHRRERVFFVAHAGRALRQGLSTQGDVQEATGTRNADAVERPSSAVNTDRGREPEPRLGGMVDGLPAPLDGIGLTYWQGTREPERVSKGTKDRGARLRALGNAVVPQQVYPIFKAIMEVDAWK